ncbi:MAG: aconitate hydratase [Pusillimonas sp.]|jgi:aconitate hydratase|nr:aconitate hydratase [Pusillimonas sp.]MBC41664.1 aconitate hydratase [Pusillimonas sp.]|tara:strand:+ start:86862 stop:89666 length:2805 start_codon:yes stop_codon:yes gene_type:complete
MTHPNSFDAKQTLKVGKESYEIYRLDAVKGDGLDVSSLPYSLKILLENLLRTENGSDVTADDIRALAGWDESAEPNREIAFTPARVVLQDFTGVPAVVDLATMREAVKELGGDPTRINPLAPVELVIDHSVIVDVFGQKTSFEQNVEIEYKRNLERYQFLRWGQNAFENFKVVPPGTGIVHQVNLEHLSRVVFTKDQNSTKQAYPDTCVGTDSHTPMVNGLGIVAWGVGGIEAEAAMLGQPISMLIPRVVGFKLTGSLPEGTTATDLVLTITEMLRKHRVVGKFVEFYGPGVASVPLANRATIGNMSPEYGSTIAIFPVDEETLRYMQLTGRSDEQIALVKAYAKEQGLWHDPNAQPRYSEMLELDLSTVVPSIAGPKRPQDRIALTDSKSSFRSALSSYIELPGGKPVGYDKAVAESFPASDPPAQDSQSGRSPTPTDHTEHAEVDPAAGAPVRFADGTECKINHGAVAIAAITSCTNTSNPAVMIAAALLAKKAVEKGLKRKPWVKTSLAPGSRVVTDYYERAGLTPYLDELGFNLVGYGCTTCIGNSGPLIPEVSESITKNDLSVVSVLSGNRNFEGRIHPEVKMNYLMSPPLVVAYALAGTMDLDMYREPLGQDHDGKDVYLKDIWPATTEVQAVIDKAISEEMYAKGYRDVFAGDDRWQALPTPSGQLFEWEGSSTYVRKPPYFENMPRRPDAVSDIKNARVLALLGDSVTTDHISPAGSIAKNSPAAQYLKEHGVEPADFNSYGSRRGNHEVMIRGTFANVRLRNQLAPETEGGYTRDFTRNEGPVTTIYDASRSYLKENTPLVILAGKEYGSGSSRDWAAKGTVLLGVRAVIAESYERIHRSNLLGMGVLPLQFPDGQSIETLGLTGEEQFDISGIEALNDGTIPKTVMVKAGNVDFEAIVRIDTPSEAQYYRNGGIMQYVLRNLLD